MYRLQEKHEACYPLMNTSRGALFADCIAKHEELSKFYYAQCNYDMKKRTTQMNMEALCDIVSAFSRHCTFSGLFVPWYNDSAYITRCGTFLNRWRIKITFNNNYMYINQHPSKNLALVEYIKFAILHTIYAFQVKRVYGYRFTCFN